MIKQDRDTTEQNVLFEQYLKNKAELEDRIRRGSWAYSYDEVEWEAFQYGWNAAKRHFGIEQ